METEKLNNLYELTRNYLINSEAIERSISEIKNSKLSQHLTETLKTVQADLLILNETVYNAMSCEDETELNDFLSSEQDDFEEPKFEVN